MPALQKVALKTGGLFGCLGLFCCLSLLNACSSIVWQEQAHRELPRTVQLPVPFFPQSDYHCGPAALAGIFHYHALPASPEQVAQWVYLPGRKGSLQIEITAAIRRQKLLAYPLEGSLDALLTEITAGNPVLVLQNLGFSWWPQWHYATATGYDLNTRELILHSGHSANYRLAFTTFQHTWQRAENWALVPLPTTRLPATADKSRYLKAAADLENSRHPRAAATAFYSATQQWPEAPLAWMGLGNNRYALGQFEAATIAFKRLSQLQPDNASAWNNLAYALLAANCPQQSAQAIDMALSLATADPRIIKSHDEITQKIRLLEQQNSMSGQRLSEPAESEPTVSKPTVSKTKTANPLCY